MTASLSFSATGNNNGQQDRSEPYRNRPERDTRWHSAGYEPEARDTDEPVANAHPWDPRDLPGSGQSHRTAAPTSGSQPDRHPYLRCRKNRDGVDVFMVVRRVLHIT